MCAITHGKTHSLQHVSICLGLVAPDSHLPTSACANIRNSTAEFRSNFKVEGRGKSSRLV